MKKNITLLFCIVFIKTHSQNFTPQSINGGGGFQSNGNISFSYSIGQSGLTNTVGTSAFTLTQGFQQADIINNPTYTIAGNIISPLKYSVPNVVLKLSGSITGTKTMTGNFNITLPQGNYTVSPSKNNDINKANGVTALDIALTQAHILGKTLFNSQYKIIAADVNGDSKVTALDIVYIKRLILGIDTTFTNSTTSEKRLWTFIDSSYSFTDNSNPFPHKDSISYTGLSVSKINQTFIGCKLGDVNWDWNPAVARPKVNNTNAVELSYPIESPSVRPGRASDGYIHIPVKVRNFKDMLGMQFTISFDPTIMQWQGIGSNPLGIEIGTNHATEGSVSFLWVDKQNNIKTLDDGSVLMELVFKPDYQLSTINYQLLLDGSVTAIAAYDKDYNLHGIVLNSSKINIAAVATETWAVTPNPVVNGNVQVQMNLKVGKTIELRLIDITGRVFMVKQVDAVKGSNHITLKQQKIPSGTYYLQAKGIEGEEVKKIMIQ